MTSHFSLPSSLVLLRFIFHAFIDTIAAWSVMCSPLHHSASFPSSKSFHAKQSFTTIGALRFPCHNVHHFHISFSAFARLPPSNRLHTFAINSRYHWPTYRLSKITSKTTIEHSYSQLTPLMERFSYNVHKRRRSLLTSKHLRGCRRKDFESTIARTPELSDQGRALLMEASKIGATREFYEETGTYIRSTSDK